MPPPTLRVAVSRPGSRGKYGERQRQEWRVRRANPLFTSEEIDPSVVTLHCEHGQTKGHVLNRIRKNPKGDRWECPKHRAPMVFNGLENANIAAKVEWIYRHQEL